MYSVAQCVCYKLHRFAALFLVFGNLELGEVVCFFNRLDFFFLIREEKSFLVSYWMFSKFSSKISLNSSFAVRKRVEIASNAAWTADPTLVTVVYSKRRFTVWGGNIIDPEYISGIRCKKIPEIAFQVLTVRVVLVNWFEDMALGIHCQERT